MAIINGIPSNMLGSKPFATLDRVFILENTIDLDSLNIASGDVVQCLPVLDGYRVLGTEVEIVTPSNAATSATAILGDGSDDDGFIASINLKSSAGTVTTTPGAYGYSRRYTANATINLTATYSGATTVKGKVIVRAIVVKMNAK